MLTKLTYSRAASHVAVAIAGILLGTGALAFGATSGGTLHACAAKKDGALRLAARCTKHERALTWNLRGPQGPKGATGAAGSVGPTGATGLQGTAGTPGSPAASIMTARTSAGIGEEGYFGASGPSAISATESDVTVLTPAATTIAQSLSVTDLVSSADDNTRIYVLRVNGTDTAVTCSIVGGAHNCTDSTHSVTIPPDSQVSIHRALITGTGGGADGTAILAAWRATTP